MPWCSPLLRCFLVTSYVYTNILYIYILWVGSFLLRVPLLFREVCKRRPATFCWGGGPKTTGGLPLDVLLSKPINQKQYQLDKKTSSYYPDRSAESEKPRSRGRPEFAHEALIFSEHQGNFEQLNSLVRGARQREGASPSAAWWR